METDSKGAIGQIVWGALLLAAGIGVFFRIPQVMPKIAQIEQFANITILIRFCFYFIGVVLIGGGAKKIHDNYRRLRSDKPK